MRTNLIIGGTGTLGQALLNRLDTSTCVVFSRDELKQQELKKLYPDLKYVIGDIRDQRSLDKAMPGIDTVYHFAALKHVDVLEDHVEEAVKTNFYGTVNAANSAISHGVKRFLFTSTDKAVMPINAYGMSKGLAEKYILSLNNPSFYIFRWGNIIGSRGSVIPSFIKAIHQKRPVKLTHNEMSRFWIRVEDALDFMLDSSEHSSFDINIPNMGSAPVSRLIRILSVIIHDLVGDGDYVPPEIITSDVRPGEKLHEVVQQKYGKSINSSENRDYCPNHLYDLLLSTVKDCLNV